MVANRIRIVMTDLLQRKDWPRIMPTVITIVVSLAILYTLSQCGWFFFHQQVIVARAKVKPPLLNAVVPLAAIPTWHLFGNAEMDVVSAKTNLPLTLVGIILAPSVDDSSVIISSENQEQKIYHLKDQLPGGAIVYRIMPDAVIIQHNGHLERLPLLQPQSESPGNSKENELPQTAPDNNVEINQNYLNRLKKAFMTD